MTCESATGRLDTAAQRVVELLTTTNQKIVFAESCTAGLIAASLGQTPGISNHLCGSAVVYREATKTAWLGVSSADLANPQITAVSREVAGAMAIGVLSNTPEADLSASVTGFLGPNSPPGKDGLAIVGVAQRDGQGNATLAIINELRLESSGDRFARQREAATAVLDMVAHHLSSPEAIGSD